MRDSGRIPDTSLANLSTAAQEIVRHLCESDCRSFGSVTEWCETRGDCTYAVQCPGCSSQFVIDEEDLVALEAWTRLHGQTLVCGIRDAA
jgi:hypothetical protein